MRMHYLLKPKARPVKDGWLVAGFGAGGMARTLDGAYLRWLNNVQAHVRGCHDRAARNTQ